MKKRTTIYEVNTAREWDLPDNGKVRVEGKRVSIRADVPIGAIPMVQNTLAEVLEEVRKRRKVK